MPITVTEPGDGGTLVTVPEPASPPAAPAPDEPGDPGASATPPAPDPAAVPAPDTESGQPSDSAPDVPETPTETSEDDDEDERREPMTRRQERSFARIRRDREEARREAAALKARLEMLEQGYRRPAPEPPPVPLHQQPEPREEDYPSQPEWFKAVREWDKAQLKHELAREQQQQRQQQEALQHEQQMREQATAARQKYADFDTVLDRLSGIYTAPTLDACVHESELGAELAYYLGQHPEEITRLNQVAQLHPLAMAREVGKLEVRLSPPTNGTSPRPSPPLPKPAPPTPLSGAGSPGTRLLTDMSDEEVAAMSQAEFEAAYKRQFPQSR